MRAIFFTSNALRHKFVANSLAGLVTEALIVTENIPNPTSEAVTSKEIQKHFHLRQKAEEAWFGTHITFKYNTLHIEYGALNSPIVLKALRDFNPDVAVAFGCSIIREPLLSSVPRGRFLNLHLGLSPYYRGSGTNFWPFVFNELEYVGATILHIDAGIDTGDIVAHAQPIFKKDDDVHSLGCRTIQSAVDCLKNLFNEIAQGRELERVPQWKEAGARYCKKKDFTEASLRQYYDNLEQGIIDKYLKDKPFVRLVTRYTNEQKKS